MMVRNDGNTWDLRGVCSLDPKFIALPLVPESRLYLLGPSPMGLLLSVQQGQLGSC